MKRKRKSKKKHDLPELARSASELNKRYEEAMKKKRESSLKFRMKRFFFKHDKPEISPEDTAEKKQESETKPDEKVPDKPVVKEEKPVKEKRSFFKRKEKDEIPKDKIEKVKKKDSNKRIWKKRKPKKRRLRRKSLEEYLEKAGFSVSAQKVRRGTFYGCIIAFLIVSAGILFAASTSHADPIDLIIFFGGLWTVVFIGVLLVLHMFVFFFLDYVIYKRTKELEEVLPDFLQLASSNIAAGMSVDKALWLSIRPNFGVLAREMEEVAKATMAGESLEQSLEHFANKYDSKLLQRSVSILIEGLHAGGEMADLLNKIALNIDEIKIMKKEMAANVTTYAIFITFASILIAPFLFALATQLLEVIVGITATLDLSASSQLFTITATDPQIVKNFKIFSVISVFFSTIFSTSIVSVIRRGNIMDGIKMIPVYAVAAVFIYYFALILLVGLFGGLV